MRVVLSVVEDKS
jgi:hypothetical protein